MLLGRKRDQAALLWFEQVLEIDGMIPWLSKGKPTSGLLREDVEIRMVTRGNELFRRSDRFFGGHLNLGLMNPFQGFSFVFLVEGGEMLSMILEHETGARTPVKLYRALFPVY